MSRQEAPQGKGAGAAPVSGIQLAAYTVPLEQPESDGTLTWKATTVVTAEVTAAGVTGLGWTYATPACVRFATDVLTEVVEGRDAHDVPGSWSAMAMAIRNMGRPGVSSMAIAALDTALWDLKAKLVGLPLARLLGMVRTEVPVYGSGGFTSLSEAELVAQIGGWANDQGIPRVKLKIGTSWGAAPERDLERVRLCRQVIGGEVELFVDANGGYSRKQAIRMAERLADLGVVWFEEPVSSDDLGGLHEVRAATAIDVAAGEYGYDLVYFERMCAAGAVDCLQADVSRCAGITEWLRAASVAAAHGLQISGHCAQSLHAHPATAVQNLRHLEYFADHARVDRILFDGVLDPAGGALRPDLSRPGIGIDLKRADAERYRVG